MVVILVVYLILVWLFFSRGIGVSPILRVWPTIGPRAVVRNGIPQPKRPVVP